MKNIDFTDFFNVFLSDATIRLGFFLLWASGLEQQPSRPPPAAEAGRRGWGRALIFQSLAKRPQKKSASATRQGGISAVTKATVRLWLARGSQRLGMSNVVAVSCNPYEESKEHGRPQAAKKSPVGSFLVLRVAAPSIRACLGRHLRLAGRCPNNSSLHRPLAAVVVVASPIL